MMAAALRSRAKAGMALVEELEAYAVANPPKRAAPGFRAIDPVTGMDGRPKIGRRRPKEL